MNYDNLVKNEILSEEFIEKYLSKIDLKLLVTHQKLSEYFIEKHINELEWSLISQFQKLSEEFIEKHAKRIYWQVISKHQELSHSFILKWGHKLDHTALKQYQKEYKPSKMMTVYQAVIKRRNDTKMEVAPLMMFAEAWGYQEQVIKEKQDKLDTLTEMLLNDNSIEINFKHDLMNIINN